MEDNEIIEMVEKAAGSVEQWIQLMKFGTPTFQEKPLLAMEMVVREAERARSKSPKAWTTSDRVVDLLKRLDWVIDIREPRRMGT